MISTHEILVDRMIKFGTSSDVKQRNFDNLISNESAIRSHPLGSYIHNECRNFIWSVSWTDTERDSTFTSSPTAIVLTQPRDATLVYPQPDDQYYGHIYVWEDSLLGREANVIGLRKSISLIMDESKIRIAPILIKAVEDWAIQRNISIVRIQDPLPNAINALIKLGYTMTARWHDLSVGLSIDKCDKLDAIKILPTGLDKVQSTGESQRDSNY